MSAWWPSSTHPCRVDLLVAELQNIRNSVACVYPSMPLASRAALVNSLASTSVALRTATVSIGGTRAGIDQVADSAAAAISAGIRDTLGDVGDGLQSFVSRVGSNIGSSVNTAGAALTSTINKVTGSVGSALNAAGDALEGVVGSVKQGVSSAINAAGAGVASVVNTAKTGIGNVIDQAGDFVTAIVTGVTSGIRTVIDGAASAVGTAVNAIKTTAGNLISGAGSFLGDVITNVRAFIGNLISNVQTGIGGIVAKLSSIPDALGSFANELITAAGEGLPGLIEGIGKFLSDPVEGIIGGFFHGEEPMLLDMVNDLYDRILANPEAPPEVKAAINKAKVPGAPVPALVAAVVIPFILVTSMSTVLQPILAKVIQAENEAIRPSLLGLGDAVQSFYRGTMTRGELAAIAAKHGFEDIDVERALTLGQQRATPVDLTDWMHRGLIQPGSVVERLQDDGWRPGDATNIVEASAVIPPLSDLVRFAVREAFPGQTGFSGARGLNVPVRFVELAEQQGLDPEFARSYWAAHWDLPSVSTAFAMFHRRQISEGELRQLLREQDMAPEWVERTIDVAYDPLTRVDVRRMRSLGVLSKSAVRDAYLDLGYSPTNADRLADFVEADIAAGRDVETAPERDLTRADIVGAYADGVLTRSVAKSHLDALGYDADEAELILDREDIRQARAERKETKSAIVEQAVAAVITLDQAQDKLAQADYTTDEIKAAMREVERKLAAQVTQPTKAQLDAFRKAKLIDDDEYATELRRLGYAERWVAAFVALGTKGTVGNA